jgi:hypothetical protein
MKQQNPDTNNGEIILENETHLLENVNSSEVALPVSGHGACKSCGCRGYRPGKETGYCKCEHSFYQHEGSNW